MNTPSFSDSSITFTSMVKALEGIPKEQEIHTTLFNAINICPLCRKPFIQSESKFQHLANHSGNFDKMEMLKSLNLHANMLLEARANIYMIEGVIAHSELTEDEGQLYAKIRQQIDSALFFS